MLSGWRNVVKLDGFLKGAKSTEGSQIGGTGYWKVDYAE